MFELKRYQTNTLDMLRRFLREARLSSPESAYRKVLSEQGIAAQYNTHGLGDIPYVCFRLPTGGGKTVLASYSIKEAAQNYLEKDYPLVLWLVPTNAIRTQTIEALKMTDHPYRQAINEYFDGNVALFDIADVELIRPQDLKTKLCIVVGTLATLRVQETTGRLIYAHSEKFESHFVGMREQGTGLEHIEAGPDQGKTKYSFANLCHINKPLIIMDEAHNARTSLTFEILKRVSPSCIIEFTATPDTTADSGSNILYAVSASELKAEEMIKLPIILSEHQTWQEAVRDAVLTRKHLAEKAKGETDFVRPIALFQAESKDREVTTEVLQKYLIETEKVDADAIAIATGTQWELDGINLFDRDCKIEHIITVEALKEGWDCSFAYVFCSVANIQSSRDIEQILGRVLRMPYARRRKVQELNYAYAHVSSPTFSEAAQRLADKLVNMGFEELEAQTNIQPVQTPFLFGEPGTLAIKEAPKFVYKTDKPVARDSLSDTLKDRVEISVEDGITTITYKGVVDDEIEKNLPTLFKAKQKEDFANALKQHKMMQMAQMAPAMRGEMFEMPRLCVAVQGELELAERELFLEAGQWNLLDNLPALTETEFKLEEKGHSFEIDLEGRKVVYHTLEQMDFVDLNDVPTSWTELELVRWLDIQLHQPDVRQPVMLEFLRRATADLTAIRKIPLAGLVRAKYILAKVLEKKIAAYRAKTMKQGFQKLLFDEKQNVETSFTHTCAFANGAYPAREPYYNGNYKFQKHFFPVIGDLKIEGEEFDCAVALDAVPEVKYWIRNIPRYPEVSFFLPTSDDNFYPDFVALLKDGRLLVVEYKGGHLEDSGDTLEKLNIGQLWEEKSKGKCLFLMTVREDKEKRNVQQQLKHKISL